MHLSTKYCAVCGHPLSVHERAAGETCADPRCKHTQLTRQLQRQHEQYLALEEKAQVLKQAAAQAFGVPCGKQMPVAIVPSNERPLVNLPERRRRVFRDRLQRVISKAASQVYGHAPRDPQDAGEDRPDVDAAGDPEPPHQGLLGAACAICRGHCCAQGGDHAFLHPKAIRRYMARHPEERPRHILDAYLARLGARAYRSSCVYHDVDGCRLPRDMRTSLCNDFLCKGLNEFIYRLDGKEFQQAFAVASEEGRALRIGLLDEHGATLYKTGADGDNQA